MSTCDSVTVLGLDLSLASTGLAYVMEDRVYGVHRIASTGKDKAPLPFTAKRLDYMAGQIEEWIAGDDADLAVIESPSFGSVGGKGHERAALWWRVVGVLVREEIPVATVAPTTRAKYGTGNGRADKKEVVAAVEAAYDVDWPAKGKRDDIADAVLLAAMGARYLGHPIDGPGTPAQLQSMKAFKPPEEVKAA